MEKIIILGCALASLELIQWFLINRALQGIRSIRFSYVKLATHHNIAVLDLSRYIKMDLQQKSQTRELSDEEKTMFAKCHAMIFKIEEEFKNIGLKSDVIL